MDLIKEIRSVPDFPKKGIVFRDITTLLKSKEALACAVDALYDHYKGLRVDKVVSVESRGYILGAPLAYKLGAGFVPIRKPGKLPAATLKQEYALEYGTDAVEIHKDAISAGERILLHDDLLATGGTIGAACQLVEKLGGKIVGVSFLIELTFLQARKRLGQYDIFSLIKYDSE
ncbi:MAG TPA: adenine phosphoribosyltransferase [Bacteroidetes bacterium]|jgi:adenine phosphoribosyltransferase|nr:adenine phosphoribosyltransferase [Bacteroidota bacterium]